MKTHTQEIDKLIADNYNRLNELLIGLKDYEYQASLDVIKDIVNLEIEKSRA